MQSGQTADIGVHFGARFGGEKLAAREIIHQGNSTISIELLPDYAQPVVVKKPAKRHASPKELRSLDNEYAMTRALNAVEGVR